MKTPKRAKTALQEAAQQDAGTLQTVDRSRISEEGASVETPPRSAGAPSSNPDDLWIQTRSRKRFDFVLLNPDAVCIEDVAFALSNLNRFNGHVGQYSVAEHSVRVAAIAWSATAALPHQSRKWVALAALLHDAAEAYTGDIVTPVKRLLFANFSAIEKLVSDALKCPDIGADAEEAVVKKADLTMLATEVRDLMKGTIEPWPMLADTPPLRERLVPWREKHHPSPPIPYVATAERLFLRVHAWLAAKPGTLSSTHAIPAVLINPNTATESAWRE